MVVLPLMVRDVYMRGAVEIALIIATFPLGTVSGSIVLMRRGGIKNLMAAQFAALISAGLVLIVISMNLPFWGVLAGIYVWGLFGSVFMIAGRTLFQQRASEANRGRVLAAYTMGFMGAAGLIGAPLSAALTRELGPQGALAVLGTSMLVLVAGVMLHERMRA
jgi:MFS family permease